MENLNKQGLDEIKEKLFDAINDGYLIDKYGCDLHNEVYNKDYFIIGRWNAEQWLTNNYGIFTAIEKIKEYENMAFGEVSTDFSEPERVLNMLVYILGEELLYKSETLNKQWDEKLTAKDLKKIAKELK